ncbi:protein kinase [bacterium]|nr:protein kinase [bacterium]
MNLDADNFPTDRYEPIKKLGMGANGEVYLATDKTLGKRVAVKILHTLDRDQLIQFQDEARATSKLNHTNIIDILDFGATDSGIPYMVLEYFPGLTLESHLREVGYLEWQTVANVLKEVCVALDYAHGRRIFHRDLTPSNILIRFPEDSTDGTSDQEISVRLIDFGVAKVSEMSGFVTEYQGMTLAGTPDYMSPDVVNGLEYTVASEVYSIGCIMYQAISGFPPFKADTALETLSFHANKLAETLSSATGRDIPQSVESLVAKCLAKRPEDRFQTMEELKNALVDLNLSPYPESSEVDGFPSEPSGSRGVSTSRIVSVILFLLLTGTLFAYFNLFSQDRETEQRLDQASRALLKSVDSLSRADTIWQVDEKPSTTIIEQDTLTIRGVRVLTGQDLRECRPERFRHMSLRNIGSFHDSSLKVLGGTATLKSLEFSFCDGLTDADLARISAYLKVNDAGGRNLIELEIARCYGITDKGGMVLATMPALQVVVFRDVSVGDGTIEALRKLPVRKLLLSTTEISDRGLSILAGMKSLKELHLRNNPELTRSAVNRFKKRRPDCRLIDQHDPVDDRTVDVGREFFKDQD